MGADAASAVAAKDFPIALACLIHRAKACMQAVLLRSIQSIIL